MKRCSGEAIGLATTLVIAAIGNSLHLAHAAATPIEHVVIIYQENRTPDNLFHGLRRVLPDADIADVGTNSHGVVVTLTSIPLSTTFDLGHTHRGFVAMYNGGKMNGADKIVCTPIKPGTTCPSKPQFRYVNPVQVAPYFQLAENYGFANRMFQTNQGPSFPSHQIIFSGTSQLNPYSNHFASENMVGSQSYAGCDAPASTQVETIGPTGVEDQTTYPCFEHQSLADLLDHPPGTKRKPISWRYYSSDTPIWLAPAAIKHICKPTGDPPQCTSTQWTSMVVLNPSQILNDVAQSKLSAVSWVIPSFRSSDHPGYNDGSGPAWVTSIVNAVGQSAYWNSTAIFITWDDWGGWYDHVKPPKATKYGYYEYGFRVPLLVVSAYTPAGYISNVQHDFGSILHFVEETFDLGFIPPGTFADSQADDLMDFFDFSTSPRTFVPISAAGLPTASKKLEVAPASLGGDDDND